MLRAVGEKHRDQLTWEAEAILNLAHGAVGGPHGSEGGLALHHVVLSGDQLLPGEELALTHLLWDFKTNAVPLCPDPVLGQAARRRARFLRAGVYVCSHKHIPTQPDRNHQSLLHTLEPPETGDLTALSLFRQVQSGTSPPHLTELRWGSGKAVLSVRTTAAYRRYPMTVPLFPMQPRAGNR